MCSFLNLWFGLLSDFMCVLRPLGDMCVVGAGRPACSKVVLMYSSTFAASLSVASFDPLEKSLRSKTSMKSRRREHAFSDSMIGGIFNLRSRLGVQK